MAAQDIKREVSESESLNRLKEALLKAFKEQRTKTNYLIKLVEIDGLCGVKSGQLYYVINDIKCPSDTKDVDSLKDILFNLIFKSKYEKKEKEGDLYYCAKKEQWKEVLGKLPEMSLIATKTMPGSE